MIPVDIYFEYIGIVYFRICLYNCSFRPKSFLSYIRFSLLNFLGLGSYIFYPHLLFEIGISFEL